MGGSEGIFAGKRRNFQNHLHILLSFAAALLLFSIPAIAHAADHAAIGRQFRVWLADDLWPDAKKLGVSQATFAAAFKGVSLNWKLPDLIPPGEKPRVPKAQRQAEFGSPGAYFAESAIGPVVAGGRARLDRYASTLSAVEKRYGVPGAIVLAIWGRETHFGAVKIPYDAFEVLGTKAFMARRKDLFRKEVLAALQIVQKGYIGAGEMKSSWAGALGQPQFLPSSYLEHAVDFDGDGKRDIWNSVPDTLASIAHYLQQYGWARGRGWGYEVRVPASVSCALEGPDRGHAISEWASMGIERVGKRPFPAAERKAIGFLMMPAGRFGPAFIVTPNFYVLKEYNNSDLYALFIGHAADRMEGGEKYFSGPWGKVGGLYRSDVARLQRALEKKGYDVGGVDGFPGFKTRRSIGEWQAKAGRRATCFPDKTLVKELR
ncbi:MAG: lytic murein transglycosylase [Hyphomicrobiales bacterium]|nr:lytic murein transglycosylase [Hyphomicrobiales bacterium]